MNVADHRSRLVRRLQVLAGALIISCGNATFAADSYVEDANGCKAFDSHPVPNESVTWSGACKDGLLDGPGKLSWTVDGKPAGSSEGSYLKGKLEGQGVRNYKDGARYEGEFTANDPDGQGKMTRADGSVASGRWEKNKLVDADATKFGLKSNGATGTILGRNDISNMTVRANLSYDDLSPDEKHIIRSRYENMPLTDEPAYPIGGPEKLLRGTHEIARKYGPEGRLDLVVDVDAKGVATGVSVIANPGQDLVKDVATLLMLQKYKPALCAGQPCKGQYPFGINFLGATSRPY